MNVVYYLICLPSKQIIAQSVLNISPITSYLRWFVRDGENSHFEVIVVESHMMQE